MSASAAPLQLPQQHHSPLGLLALGQGMPNAPVLRHYYHFLLPTPLFCTQRAILPCLLSLLVCYFAGLLQPACDCHMREVYVSGGGSKGRKERDRSHAPGDDAPSTESLVSFSPESVQVVEELVLGLSYCRGSQSELIPWRLIWHQHHPQLR